MERYASAVTVVQLMSEQYTNVELYLQQKGWYETARVNGDQITLKNCPLPDCGDDRYKFAINKKTFLWQCFKCGKGGNEYKLKVAVNDRTEGMSSTHDTASAKQMPDALPDIAKAHERLLADDEVLNYLNDERGFDLELVKRMKLGVDDHYFEGTKFKCLLYPYYKQGNLVFAKWRTLPPAKKDFRSTLGREQILYNADAITQDMEELICVEGEADTLACLANKIENVVGVPGANQKKITWDRELFKAKKRYLLFDNDQAGQEGAYKFAIRFGIESFYNIVLPPFTKVDGTEGKDINEWFQAGGTIEEFELLKQSARPFEIAGCTNALDALDEVEKEIEEHGVVPEFQFPWPSLNSKAGGFKRGQLVAVEAEGKCGKTTLCQQVIDEITVVNKESVMMYCLEMPPKDLVRKLVSYLTKTPDNPLQPGEDPHARKKEFLAATAQARQIIRDRVANGCGDFIYGYNNVTKEDEVFETIKAAVRRYGVSVVCFDNLQLLADVTLKNMAHRTTHLSKLTKAFKRLAMELNIVVILIVQPKRVNEGEVVSARHSDGSSAIEKDVDLMICMHRNRMAKMKAADLETVGTLDTASNFEPKLYIRVDLSRFAPGGQCTLWMEGAMSWIREMNPDEGGVPLNPTLGGEGIPVSALPMEAV